MLADHREPDQWSDPQLLAHRARLLTMLGLGAVVLFAIADPLLSPAILRSLWGVKAAMCFAFAVYLWALRGTPSERSSRWVALAGIATSCFGSAASGVLTNDELTTQMMCVSGLLLTSLTLPWGVRWQSIAAATAGLAIAINVVVIGRYDYPLVASLVLLVASVFIAERLYAHQAATARVHAAIEASERFLRQMTDQLPALISYLDTEGRYRFVNRALAVWARRSPEAMLGARLAELTEPYYVAILQPHVTAALAGERRAFEIEVPDPNNEIHTLAHVLEPDFDETGKVRGFFSLARDVTDTKRAEESVRRHQAELAHVNRLTTMGEMAAAMAHELSQPLQAIAAYAVGCAESLPADAPCGEQVRAMTTQVTDEALRAGEIIRRLQRLARKADPKVEAVDANTIVHNALRLVRAEAEQLGIELELELASGLPPVRADGIQIEQVLMNLLLNAIQAVDRGDAPRRRILTRTRAADHGVSFSVEDSGPGIAPEDRQRIFEPYFTTRAEGLGMGLAISRSILDAHEGTLTLVDPPDGLGGACFRLWLPTMTPAPST